MSSGIEVGEDQSFYTPLTHDGNVEPGTLGCFPGDCADLNIQTPEPGFQYLWARNNDTEVAKYERRGWEVDLTQPKRRITSSQRMGQFNIDSSTVRGDVVLLRIPEELYRRIQLDDIEAAKAARQDPAAGWTNNPEILSLQDRLSSGLRGPLAFRYPQHRMESLSTNPK
jgi:hypothetical protein